MRLIDADKFVLALMDASLSSVDEDTILDLVDSIHAVDAVPVVRCKDCIHCGFCGKETNLEEMGFYGYCSRGKRKDGDA